MECAGVGAEAWMFFAIATGSFIALVVRARTTQRWLREHPRAAGGFGLWPPFSALLEERRLWLFRVLFGPIPFLFLVASLAAVYCFFHGADIPPPGR